MFIIKHNNKRYGKKVFAEYEEARSYARKVIRKRVDRCDYAFASDLSDLDYYNPSISNYGFSVAKI
jgi:hypothetical protein